MKCHWCGKEDNDPPRIGSMKPVSYWAFCVECYETPEVWEWIVEQRGRALPTMMNGKWVVPYTHANGGKT